MSHPNEPNEPGVEDMDAVDAHPDAHRATEPDEEQVLRELYGGPSADGVYRGEG